jgi:hypothetical protein
LPGLILLLLRFLLAAALYAFLGWALWLLFQDLRQRSGSLASPAAPPLVLTQLVPELVTSKDLPGLAQMQPQNDRPGNKIPDLSPLENRPLTAPAPPLYTFHVTSAEAIMGRDPTCQIYVDHPTISARHARLAYHHAQWWVEDLHSRNGSWLNGQPVDDAVVLTQGDELRCGVLTFLVSME